MNNYCSKCGAKITDETNYCPNCGYEIHQTKINNLDMCKNIKPIIIVSIVMLILSFSILLTTIIYKKSISDEIEADELNEAIHNLDYDNYISGVKYESKIKTKVEIINTFKSIGKLSTIIFSLIIGLEIIIYVIIKKNDTVS